MALDSRDKRASAIGVGLPWRVYANPDGSFNQGDRQQTAMTYRGIEADEATVPNLQPQRQRSTGRPPAR